MNKKTLTGALFLLLVIISFSIIVFAQGGPGDAPPDCHMTESDSWWGGTWISPTWRIFTDSITSANSWWLDSGVYTYTMAYSVSASVPETITGNVYNIYTGQQFTCTTSITGTGEHACSLHIGPEGYYRFAVGTSTGGPVWID